MLECDNSLDIDHKRKGRGKLKGIINSYLLNTYPTLSTMLNILLQLFHWNVNKPQSQIPWLFPIFLKEETEGKYTYKILIKRTCE